MSRLEKAKGQIAKYCRYILDREGNFCIVDKDHMMAFLSQNHDKYYKKALEQAFIEMHDNNCFDPVPGYLSHVKFYINHRHEAFR